MLESMLFLLRKYRVSLVWFLLFMIPIMSIDTALKKPRDHRLLDQLLIGLTYPVQSGLTWLLEKCHLGFHRYIFLVHTEQENKELIGENLRLQNVIAGLRETEQENVRLQRLLNFQNEQKLPLLIARVIAQDVSTEFRSIRVNRGSAAGVKRDMAVLTEQGIVGRVFRTTPFSADIVTLVDVMSSVDAIVQRSRAHGIVGGYSEDTCQLKFALRTDDIQTGDVLISSGLSEVFPKGLMVGFVSRVQRKPYGITQEVEVKPSVDFSKLEEVGIVLAPRPTKD
jgi:rod shape-determining protein MreC